MIPRPVREDRPHRAPYVSVVLPVPGGERPWTFRIPRWSQIAPHSRAAADAGSDGTLIDAAYGRIVAMAWADEEWALESDPSDGEAVFAELYEAGWPTSVLYALANRLQEEAGAELPKEKEVREKLRFFGVNGAAGGLTASSPPGSTAGTSAPTT